MRLSKTTYLLGAVLLVLAVTWVFFHRQVNQSLGVALLLRSPSPREEVFEQLATGFSDPTSLLEQCWATAKVPQRQLVASFLRNQAAANPKWFTNAQRLVLAGTADPDMSVRELALATLQARADPNLFPCARAQLQDPDPLVRQLGLDYVRQVNAQQGVPITIGLLNDPDLRVVASAEVALTRWTGQDYGVRTHLAIPSGDAGRQLDPAHVDAIRNGVERRKQWWQAHAQEFPAPETAFSKPLNSDFSCPAVEDFTLQNFQGKRVRLSDFRGKTVLINFWATWCTACLAEIPDLIELHKKLGDRVVILGVALDGLPDEHGHKGGEEGEVQHEGGPSRKAVINKVVRAVKSRGINYPVLLDPDAKVGCRFNGGELPTTVMIDRHGKLRRRFIGERNVQVFEAMLGEIGK
jgi:thiol-disulfide isomerase/thioredoxin